MRIADILRKPPADMSEVQDFSMGKNRGQGMLSAQTSPTSAVGKGKLNDTLSKLMKKNNMSMDDNPEPLSKEKKRRKLDEIVMGLSASKEQKSIFGDPGLSMSSSKKQQVTPSVSVTPTNIQSQSQSQHSNQKPFTITVTSVPGTIIN
jgi:chromodomain-helicase-DNA-binding protein 7